MQPEKLWMTSKNALLQSVTRASSAKRSAGTVSLCRAARHISNCLMALAVHTDQCPSNPRLRDGLACRADEACDHGQRPLGPVGGGLRGQFKHRSIQAGVADGELRSVDADGKTAGAGVDIIARQRPLMDDIERAI